MQAHRQRRDQYLAHQGTGPLPLLMAVAVVVGAGVRRVEWTKPAHPTAGGLAHILFGVMILAEAPPPEA